MNHYVQWQQEAINMRPMLVTDQLMKVNESEVKTILKLNQDGIGHSNIVKLYEIIDDDNLEDKLVIVMENCSIG